MNIKEELLAEAALILEQEGWLIRRFAHEIGSSRLRMFAKRYENWQNQVNEFREQSPENLQNWPIPLDNS